MSKATQAVMLKQLKDPFDPKFVKFRVGATSADKKTGIALAYIDSREVMKRLDDVCGIGGWRKRLTHFPNGFVCEIDILVDGEWVTRSDAAAYTHIEPEKGGASDAFKRAAANWGIGRYLYYLPNIWVAIKPVGKSYVLAETPALPEWAKPNPQIERWEDVAELELDEKATADEQEIASVVIANIDKIRETNNLDELNEVVEELTPEDRTILAEEINAKTREFLNERTTKNQTANS